MSRADARHNAARWLSTGRDDLTSAEILKDAGRHAHACFLAQQGAEKAVKAMWYMTDQDPWGHSVQRLLEDLSQTVSLAEIQDLTLLAASLDKYYIPTRYPNGLPDLTPHKVYSASDSQNAISSAEQLLAAAERFVSQRQ